MPQVLDKIVKRKKKNMGSNFRLKETVLSGKGENFQCMLVVSYPGGDDEDPQWMSEIMGKTKYHFLPIYIYDKFKIRHSKRLKTIKREL